MLLRARSWAWLASGALTFACNLNPHPDLPVNPQPSLPGSGGTAMATGGSTANIGGNSTAGSLDLGQGGTQITVPAAGGATDQFPGADQGGAAGASETAGGAAGESAGGAGGERTVK